MDLALIINFVYVVAAALFIVGLKLLGHPSSARKGNTVSALGMLLAIVVTLFDQNIISYEYIVGGLLVGAVIGVFSAQRVQMTGMPELVSIFNGFGGIASLLVGLAVLPQLLLVDSLGTNIAVVFTVIVGAVTFTGSLVAWGKLSTTISGRAMVFSGQRYFNILLLLALLVASVIFSRDPSDTQMLWVIVGLGLVVGLFVVLPVGGGDMPVIISLLNSYSGLAASAAGFATENNLLIVAGALVGTSGVILTTIMCKAMNRSLMNVLLSGFSSVVTTAAAAKLEGEVKPASAEDAYYVLEAASSVVIIPGYGMAVAQAQHAINELHEALEANGAEVAYAIHPVAGRMPGHMNVLLAEADIAYEHLYELEEINPRMDQFDVAIVIGANDVVNSAANEVPGSPLEGMPVFDVAQARSVFVLKRSMGSGFAGVDNPLFFKDNTRMIFGDAKESVNHMVREFTDD